MKKIISTLILFLTTGTIFAQTVTLTFTAKDAANHYVQLNRVIITNLTKSWQETIYWPDTVLTMQNGTGIDDHTPNGGFALSQNNPNPFSGTTEVNLTTVDEGKVDLDIKDMNGRIIETQNLVSLQPGNHQFRISLSTAGTYVMTARQNGKTSSIKMICNGGGGSNTLDYLGMVQTITVVLKSSTNKPFNFGDIMQYVGYGTVDGTELESSHIVQAQNSSQMFTLQFTTQGPQLPIVTTHSVTNITDVSASCGGTVNSDGGSAVTARGICWSATQNPTVSNLHTTNGSGTGSFTSNLTGLTPNITYYVRAYATNAVGTAYGQQEVFNTNPSLASVTTAAATNITISSATLGGTVTSDGGSTVTERGCCWGIHQNPTITSHYGGAVVSANNGGTGNFSVAATGLTPGTTYYVRAYATNAAGTAYGQQITFTALVNLPAVTTNSVTNISSTTATCGGNVSSDGGGTVTARGVCWSTSQSPTVSNSHTTDGNGTGSFSSSLTGLNAGSTYYVRAYATNSAGTEYGEERSFSPMAPPTVTTGTASNITCSSATISGVVTNDNGSPVTDRGFQYYRQGQGSQQISAGSGSGSFTCTITGLTAGNTYYARAYAINSAGISYGENISFNTPSMPLVTSLTVSNITDTSATYVGSVTSDGGSAVTERGVFVSTSPEPSIYYLSGYYVPSGSGTGSFTVNLSSLTPLTRYYVRTYATNCAGTTYGDTTSFTTTGAFTCGISTIQDYDGNAYNTVKIGSQCWMAGNLRTKHYADGTSISNGGYGPYTSVSTAYYYYPNGNSSNGHGYLYNWKAATRTGQSSNSNPSAIQGVCPTGWHLPSKDEWLQLTDYVSDAGIYSCGNSRRNIAKALSSSWSSGDTCTVAVNATGFSSVEDGYYYNSNYSHYNSSGYYWSSTIEENDVNVKPFVIHSSSNFNYYAAIASSGYNRGHGLSVRCVSDESVGVPVTQRPYQADFSSNDWTLNNGSCSNIWHVGTLVGNNRPALYIRSSSSSNYEAYYNITSPSTVMAEKIFAMPSDDSIHVEFDVQIGGETCCDYLKAFLVPATVLFTPGSSHNTQSQSSYSNYAINFAAYKSQTTAGNNYPYVLNLTNGNAVHVSVNVANPNPDGQAKFVFLWRNDNSVGTEPGAIITSFSIGRRPCPGITTVTDYDGNVYNTLRIGDQCWMRENIRAKHYSDGTLIPEGASTSTTNAYRYAPNNDTNNVFKYGYLYNWPAAMHGIPSYDEIPSAVQGVCPTGWHLPTSDEWDILADYLGSQSACICDDYTSIAKSLAHQEGWIEGGASICNVCGNPTTNDASGLGIRPSGYYDGSFIDFGSSANLWLPTRTNSNYYLQGFYKYIYCDDYNTSLQTGYHSSIYQDTGGYGKSVRCIQGAAAPTVTISEFTGSTSTTGEGVVKVSSDGGYPLTVWGLCWSTSPAPTINGNHTVDGNATGIFAKTLSGLAASTLYYVRAYATNSIGTVYSNEVSFYTRHNDTDGFPCPNAITVTDFDNNIYPTVQLGTQCWMAENLRTTHYSDGTFIPYGEAMVASTSDPYRYFPYGASSNFYPYGFLYNWKAVMGTANSSNTNPSGVQGICPNGWHVPSDAEWLQLINYVRSQNVFTSYTSTSSYSNYIAYAMASETGWKASGVTGTPGGQADNVLRTGFSAYATSSASYGSFEHENAYFWSSTEGLLSSSVSVYYLMFDQVSLKNYTQFWKSNYSSVRCIKDSSSATSYLPAVITNPVSEITNNSAVCGGLVYDYGSTSIISRGVCWSTSQNPTVSDSHTTDGVGTGSFTSSITGLTAGITYYVRAYATNSAGTAYGEQRSFTTTNSSSFTCGTSTVADHEGNVYNTVQIGNQCWTKENLRTTTSPSTGTYLIPTSGTGYTYTGKQARWYNSDSATYAPMNYGLLYNWNAAVDTFNTEYGETSVNTDYNNAVEWVTFTGHHRGICPMGWHLPSDAEWNTMEATVSGSDWQTSYETTTGSRGTHAGKLAGSNIWWEASTSGAPGDYGNADRNVSGFSAVPAGYCNGSAAIAAASQANFWSSSQREGYPYSAYYRRLTYIETSVGRVTYFKYTGYSVRCLKD